MSSFTIKRALFSVSDKKGVVELAQAMSATGTEIVATGKTAQVLLEAGLKVVPIESISGSPESFQGRMKTLSFNVCSGILFRRDDPKDIEDAKKLGIKPIDCVVVNFYPFEEAAAKGDPNLIEQIDVGGPTLVRAAAKNFKSVLVLCDPTQYGEVITELKDKKSVSMDLSKRQAAIAWQKVLAYDQAIANEFGSNEKLSLRYGENPHQKANVRITLQAPLSWGESPNELSYNNLLDFGGAYELAAELKTQFPDHTGVVIVKHNNPCGVAMIPIKGQDLATQQRLALTKAWEGDPVSAFGGILCFTDPVAAASSEWLMDKFVEGIAAPAQGGSITTALGDLLQKRKGLKLVRVKTFKDRQTHTELRWCGLELTQDCDQGLHEGDLNFENVTKVPYPREMQTLGQFGILVCRALKSNAVAIVRELTEGGYQLIGAGQGQPNRVEAIKALALPRAQAVLRDTGGKLEQCVFISDAFFPFRDSIDVLHTARVKYVIQPGGSKKDQESIDAANEHGMSMVFTKRRHFRH